MISSSYSVERLGAFRHKDAATFEMQTAVEPISSLVIRFIVGLWSCSVVALLHSGISNFIYLKVPCLFCRCAQTTLQNSSVTNVLNHDIYTDSRVRYNPCEF